MNEFEFPSEFDYDEKFVDNDALIDARKDKRIAARRRRRIIRLNVIFLCFIILAGGISGITWLFNQVSEPLFSEELAYAIINEDFELLRLLVVDGIDLNEEVFDFQRHTYEIPIIIAVRRGSVRMTQELLAHGANPNIMFGTHGATLLHYTAVYSSRNEILQILLDYTSNPNPSDFMGWTPLHRTAQAGRLDALETLLAAGADVNFQTIDGNTALHLAANAGRIIIVETLLAANADKNIENNSGDTALDKALSRGTVQIIELLQ